MPQRDVVALKLLMILVQGTPCNGVFTSIIFIFIIGVDGAPLFFVECFTRMKVRFDVHLDVNFIFLFTFTLITPTVTIKDSSPILIVIY